jgi:hypothetical protein
MVALLLWLILLVLCWPLALLALILYPIVWLLLLPFRILGIAVDGVLGILRSIILLPARLLRLVIQTRSGDRPPGQQGEASSGS